MKYNGENHAIPSFLLRAESETIRVLGELGLTKGDHGTTEQTKEVYSRVAKAASNTSLFVGRNVLVTARSHLVYPTHELADEDQDAMCTEGDISGVFNGLIVAGFDAGIALAVRLNSTLFDAQAEDGARIPKQPVSCITKVRDISSFMLIMSKHELN